MDAYVEVTDASGSTERYPIEGAQVTLGKSGTANISIPTSQELELEHLLIAPRGREGCWVSTSQGALTPTTYKGKSFASGMVKWNAELQIGKLRVKITNKKTKTKSEGGPSKVILFGGLGIVAFGAFILLKPSAEDVPTGEGIEPPALFDSLDRTCTGDGSTEENATTAEYRGHVTGDRYHYSSGDGVRAVQYYLTAVACLNELGQTGEATEVDSFREELQATIEADYAGLRLHLHHSVAVEDWRASVRDAERLVELTEHLEDDPYSQWLQQTLRIVRARELQEESRGDDDD